MPTLDAANLREKLDAWGVEVSNSEAAMLANHANLMLEANEVVNLTRITDPDEVIRLHILDSLLIAPWVGEADPGNLADIGSGAGYPGIPLAVVAPRRVTLVESVKKKAAVLDTIVTELDLDVRVCACRAEELAERSPGGFAVVTARALSSLPALVELAAPLLAPGGRLIAMKGTPGDSEVESGRLAATICGLRELTSATYALPGGQETRTVFVYVRVGKPKQHLPRRPGMAQRHPLA